MGLCAVIVVVCYRCVLWLWAVVVCCKCVFVKHINMDGRCQYRGGCHEVLFGYGYDNEVRKVSLTVQSLVYIL